MQCNAHLPNIVTLDFTTFITIDSHNFQHGLAFLISGRSKLRKPQNVTLLWFLLGHYSFISFQCPFSISMSNPFIQMYIYFMYTAGFLLSLNIALWAHHSFVLRIKKWNKMMSSKKSTTGTTVTSHHNHYYEADYTHHHHSSSTSGYYYQNELSGKNWYLTMEYKTKRVLLRWISSSELEKFFKILKVIGHGEVSSDMVK